MEEHNNNSGRPPGGGDDNKNPRNRQSILMFLIIALVAILFWNFIGNMGSSSEEITYDEFIQMLDEDKVESVEIGSSQINIISTEKMPSEEILPIIRALCRIIPCSSAWMRRMWSISLR